MKKVIPVKSSLVPDAAKGVFKGHIYNVYQWPQELFDGTTETFEMLKRTDTAVTIAVVEDKLIVLDDEQPTRDSIKTFPSGRVDKEDESTEAAARREVLEETGYGFKSWRLIEVIQPFVKIEWFVYIYLAWEPTGKTNPKLDAGEKISMEFKDFGAVKTMVRSGEGSLKDSRDIFERCSSLDDLLKLPEFVGQTVDR